MFALVRTDPGAPRKHDGISLLLIDLASPGVTVRAIPSIKGDAEFAEEFFDDVAVPKENLVGELHRGWKLANRILGSERFITGHPRHAFDMLERANDEAEASGAMDDPSFRDRLAGLRIDALAFAAFYRHAVALQQAGRFPDAMGSMMRILSGETVQRAADLVLEAAAGNGAAAGEDAAAMFFEARRASIGSGTNEIQRQVLARRVLELPR
jgi:alkylation response protein AidB-like acyl-CoA dehydrogenase